MKENEELLSNLSIPFIKIGSGCLIRREDMKMAIGSLLRSEYEITGYDAFTVRQQKRQPHMPFCASLSKDRRKSLVKILETLNDDPEYINYYELTFRKNA